MDETPLETVKVDGQDWRLPPHASLRVKERSSRDAIKQTIKIGVEHGFNPSNSPYLHTSRMGRLEIYNRPLKTLAVCVPRARTLITVINKFSERQWRRKHSTEDTSTSPTTPLQMIEQAPIGGQFPASLSKEITQELDPQIPDQSVIDAPSKPLLNSDQETSTVTKYAFTISSNKQVSACISDLNRFANLQICTITIMQSSSLKIRPIFKALHNHQKVRHLVFHFSGINAKQINTLNQYVQKFKRIELLEINANDWKVHHSKKIQNALQIRPKKMRNSLYTDKEKKGAKIKSKTSSQWIETGKTLEAC